MIVGIGEMNPPALGIADNNNQPPEELNWDGNDNNDPPAGGLADEEEDANEGREINDDPIAINEIEVQVGLLHLEARDQPADPEPIQRPRRHLAREMFSSEEISADDRSYSPQHNAKGSTSPEGPGSSEMRVRPQAYALGQGLDWQTIKPKLSDRGRHLLDTGIWSDCQFVVGIPPNTTTFRCHKMFLAMASPVFEAMFFGGLFNNEDVISILDVQPEAFSIMLEYIYTDEMRLNSFELVCDICYSAKKYMLPTLVEKCTKYLWRDLYPKNACRAYEFAKLFEEPVLLEKSIELIRTHTIEVLDDPTFEEVEHSTLCLVLSQDVSTASETQLFKAMFRWAGKECLRKGLDTTPERMRACLGEALHLIRFLTFTANDYAVGPAQSGLLSQEESFAILMNIASPGSKDVPGHMRGDKNPRRAPLPGVVGANIAVDVDMTRRYYCKREMMVEPHCLNTSILDCSVTFTVDRDICIHGIEVPSQVTDFPDNAPLELPAIPTGQTDYNELLYAHLLDSDGNRLTYTHFTAKVAWNSFIKINFNRSVCVQANRVYRIGMVLNKVGWYPMGICTRRVNCEGSFFTFCVGQPNDTLRDGLIRSIIFSK
eukprot:maker-scaffold186_size273091-snap-gene-0.16 protein:Tk00900 transcript:maker-scaffold186_size273091-snap-gene-0.16-mRNA-1 annotation:"btb poz domain-containing protein 6-a"